MDLSASQLQSGGVTVSAHVRVGAAHEAAAGSSHAVIAPPFLAVALCWLTRTLVVSIITTPLPKPPNQRQEAAPPTPAAREGTKQLYQVVTVHSAQAPRTRSIQIESAKEYNGTRADQPHPKPESVNRAIPVISKPIMSARPDHS